MNRKRFARLLCSAGLLLILCLSFATALLLGGCSGGNEELREPGYTLSFERQIYIEFKPGVTEKERTAIYENHKLRFLGPFGDMPNTYLLLLPDDMDELVVERQIEQEAVVREVVRRPVGP